MVERQSGYKLKYFHTDSGKEYTGKTVKNTFTTFLHDTGIVHDSTPAYSSSSNGAAERLNRTLLDMARPTIIKAKLPTPFWAEAVHTANKIRNRLPSKSSSKSPHEHWFGKKPGLNHLRRFGCVAFHRIPTKVITEGAKIDPRSVKCCLLGYIGNHIYRLWNPERQKLIISRDVIFHEDEFLPLSAFDTINNPQDPFTTPFDKETTPLEDDIRDDEFPDLNGFANPKRPIPTPPPIPTSPSTPASNPFSILTDDSDSDDESDDTMTPVAPAAPAAPLTPTPAPPASPIIHSAPPPTPQLPPPPPASRATHKRPTPPAPTRTNQRDRKLTKRKQEADAGARFTSTSPSTTSHTPSFDPPNEPANLDEALSSPEAHHWQAANNREMNSHLKNKTFTIVPRPTDHNVISTKFVYKLKFPETEEPIYKARFVARGFSQIPGEDYTDTFAPVPKTTTIRFLFSQAAANKLHAHHFDIETAFLIPDIDTVVYAEQPAGYIDPNYPAKDYVLLINKGINGLKQSGYLWSTNIKTKLTSNRYKQSDADEAVFIKHDGENITIIAVYVDNFLVLSNTIQRIDDLQAQLYESYTVKNLGPVKRFLGLDIYRPDPTGPIHLSQSTYARKVLHRFGMQNCNPAKAPFHDTSQLHKRIPDNEDPNEEPTDEKLYREIVGSIGYLSSYTRSDLAFPHSKLSQYLSDPSVTHMQAAKHALRYLKGNLDLCPYFAPSETESDLPLGYSDASHAADPDDRKSHSGYLFFFNGGSISHSSGKQQIVSLSSMESEYIGTTNAAQEAVFLRKLYSSITGKPVDIPIKILTDSEAALKHVKNNVNHPRTKHIDTRYHYIRGVYAAGLVELEHVPAAQQAADILTKPLGITKHLDAIKLLQLTIFPFEAAFGQI